MINLTEKQQKSRFMKGFLRFIGFFAVVFFLHAKLNLGHMQHQLSVYMTDNLGRDLGNILLIAFYLVLLYAFFYFPIAGVYYMATWEIPLPMYESGSNGKAVSAYDNSSYPNINRVMKYRESKMGMMSNDKAAQYFIKTSKLDNLYSSKGENTKRTLDYIEGRLGMMSNDKAIDFISGKLK